MKAQYFHENVFCQKPVLTQIECGVQNGPISKKGILPITTLFFPKSFFSLGTSYKELIRCTTHPNVHIHTSRQCCSFT